MSGDGGREGNFVWYSRKEAALRLQLGVWHPGLPRQCTVPWFELSINVMPILAVSGVNARDKEADPASSVGGSWSTGST